MVNKVVNIQDAMKPKDNIEVKTTTTPKKEVENIDLSPEQSRELLQSLFNNSIDPEKMKEAGMSDDQIKMTQLQLEQYKKSQKYNEAYQMLSQILDIINQDDPDLINEYHDIVYEELSTYVLDFVFEKINEGAKKVYEDVAEQVHQLLIKEKESPLIPEDERESVKYGGNINFDLYENKLPGDKYRVFKGELLESFSQAFSEKKITDRYTAYKLLEFIINSVCLKTALLEENIRKSILTTLGSKPEILDSLGIGYIAKSTLDPFMEDNNIDEVMKENINNVLDTIFDPYV